MPKFPLLALAVFVLCFSTFPALASDCTAPVQLYRVTGVAPNNWFGFSVAAVGDIDGDGKTDFVAGAAAANPNGDGFRGSAYVYSGGNGSFLYQVNGKIGGDFVGQSVAGVSDANGDGKPDLIVDGLRPPRISIYSGPDSALISEVSLPVASFNSANTVAIAEVGDINGDGKSDVLIGVPSGSIVLVYSIADDSILYQITGSGSDGFGHSVAGIGDVDDDGHLDFIVGAPGADLLYQYVGAVYVYSGSDGRLLRQVNGTHHWEYLGFSVTAVGDLDGDNKNDFIASGPFGTNSGYFFGPPFIKAFSSASGELLFEKTSSDSTSRSGWSVKQLSDVNGDGTPDFMVGAPGGNDLSLWQDTPIGVVYVYSGSDGALIYQVKSSVSWDFFGNSIADMGDIDGNGKADILIGAPENSPELRSTHPGSAYVFISKTIPKGDLNFDSTLTIADVANLVNVVFIDNSAAISPCTADLNCDGAFSPADIILLLNRVFLQAALPCS